MKKYWSRRKLKLTVPAIRAFRRLVENGKIGDYLIKMAEETNAGSVRVRYVLKNKPWVVTIEAKRHGH